MSQRMVVQGDMVLVWDGEVLHPLPAMAKVNVEVPSEGQADLDGLLQALAAARAEVG